MKIKYIPAQEKKEPFYKNVAAYCRVSTEQDIQYHSLEAQKAYYKKLIEKRIDWRFVDIYADRISGKNNLKLKRLQRLMDDCRAGKIDLILVKSISRLGRNTLQFLNLCVELHELNVEVYFEVENLYLSNPVTLQVLTIYASLYQNESQSKSAAVKWSFETAFQNGTSGFYNRPCYGYKKDKEGKMVIDPDKAEVVRLIFKMHEEKCSLRNIAAELTKRKIKTPRGKDTWKFETVRRILKNEKYYGDVVLQKTYIKNYFAGNQVTNKGEYPQYEYKNHHEAIVEKHSD